MVKRKQFYVICLLKEKDTEDYVEEEEEVEEEMTEEVCFLLLMFSIYSISCLVLSVSIVTKLLFLVVMILFFFLLPESSKIQWQVLSPILICQNTKKQTNIMLFNIHQHFINTALTLPHIY